MYKRQAQRNQHKYKNTPVKEMIATYLVPSEFYKFSLLEDDNIQTVKKKRKIHYQLQLYIMKKKIKMYLSLFHISGFQTIIILTMIRNVLKRRRECGRRLKMQKRDE